MTPRGPKSGFPPMGAGRPKGPPTSISQPLSRILSGPSAIAAQRALSQMAQRKQEWPYTHAFPPPQAVRVNQETNPGLAAPAPGVQTQVLQYQVPDGFQYAFTDVLHVYTGSGFTLGSSDITWVLDVNTPITVPAGSSGAGYPIQGLSPSILPKGAVAGGIFAPWELTMPEILSPLDILRLKVTTTAVITPGAPNFFIAVFGGWIWQTTL